VRAARTSSALVTTVGSGGISASLDDVPGADARLESELCFDGTTFDDVGTIEFGRGHLLHFRRVGIGRLTPSPDPSLEDGAVVRESSVGQASSAARRA
jgi:hypothetical protein